MSSRELPSEGLVLTMEHPLAVPSKASKSLHPHRQRDLATSRTLLKKAFQACKVTLPDGDLQFANYQSLILAPEWKFSISHSDSGALVWMLPVESGLLIGADYEVLSREISAELKSRFRSETDLEMNATKLWSLKEAIYKSIPLDRQPGLRFSHIEVSAQSFTVPPLSLSGFWKQECLDGNIQSFAWMPE
jgi:hypothetical protein